jgi:hypothetical protein
VFTCILASLRIAQSRSWKTDPTFLRWFFHNHLRTGTCYLEHPVIAGAENTDKYNRKNSYVVHSILFTGLVDQPQQTMYGLINACFDKHTMHIGRITTTEALKAWLLVLGSLPKAHNAASRGSHPCIGGCNTMFK